MKSIGNGGRTMELNILKECALLCGAIQEEQGGAFDPHMKINHAVANVIGFLIFGKCFSSNSPDFQALLNLSAESVSLVHTPLAQLYDMCPWIMRRLPGPHEIILSNYSKLAYFVRKQIEIHKKDWDPFYHRDFVDSYIGEIDKRRKDTEAGFRVENLAYCTLDMFEAGTETVTSTLRWALLNMIKYPVIQEEVHSEIERVVGRSRPPCLADRVYMPYTNAVLHETQRLGNILPMNTPRVARRDTTLGGYLIPQGTMVITSLSSVLHDKSEWETPLQFNPYHFLDSQGSFRKREAFFAFSAGKRMCLGEHLAQMELFLFFTSLLQRFSFSSPPGPELSLEAQGTAVMAPRPFKVHASPR
ncbi:cytochrome P450 2J2-like isoform X2 [Engraulis encrasicolus]